MSLSSSKPGKSAAPQPPPAGLGTPPPAARRRPLRENRTALILWLIVVGMAIFFVPLLLVGNTIRNDAARLDADFNLVVDQINAVPTPNAEIDALNAELTAIVSQTQQLQGINQQLSLFRPNWPAIMDVIGAFDPAQIQLQSLTQANNRLTLTGRALNDVAISAYVAWLEQSPLFARVIRQSIRVLPTPIITATPTLTGGVPITATATPTHTLTPSPTPDLRDEYEPDNTVADAKLIAIGQIQLHNFYPSLDVDTAQFIAKAGRSYRIYTADLSPGVDTFLTLSVGDTVYTNDDAKPGTLASEITFRNSGADVTTMIRVTNRGDFGSAKRYQLLLEETIPTPTPTLGPSPTPTPTPSPTADLRDVYEPDDITAKPILSAQPQLHNFFPDADLDQVNFLAKSGRYYRIYTTDLAPGVDTFLTVSVGDQTYTNDDVKPGSLNSEVTFQVANADLIVTARITNRGLYGADKRYQIVLEEFVPTATPPGPTVTPGNTPTPPTPDPRDGYEIDDAIPTPIAPGETQARNFYPYGDVDKVTFNAKAGRYYIIYTANLAMGVDTTITATMGSDVNGNDDYETGTGNYASAVCLTATVDAPVVALVTNNQPLFGSGRTYQLTAREIPNPIDPCVPPPAAAQGGPGRALLNWPLSRPRSIGLAQNPGFMPIEFVLIIELRVTSP